MKRLPADLLADIEKRLVAALNPEQIILFGSYAYGEPNRHSDIDLLVVVPHSEETSHRRAQVAHKAMSGLGLPTDILVMTRAEVNRKATVSSSLVRLALQKGKVIMDETQGVEDTPDQQNVEDAQREEVRQWLLKSQRDLAAAQVLMASETYLLDTAVYHCQQAAEKALKGYLAHQKSALIKTHDLGLLLDSCISLESTFRGLEDSAQSLTPYATESRYPGSNLEPDEAEAEKAVEMAQKIVNFVLKQLPDNVVE